MGCACKVSRHINKIEEKYGTNIRPIKKTNISDYIKNGLKKCLIMVILLPIIPLMFIYVLLRNMVTKKPISIDKIFNIKN
jgi:hypothetical protein